MSWSVHATNLTARSILDLSPGYNQDVSQEQFDQARRSAYGIARSGVVGDPGKHRFDVHLSGDAGVRHPANGSVVVTVSVNQSCQKSDPGN